MAEEKYIDLKKSDWKIIISLIFLPLLISVIYYSISPRNDYYKIKHYENNKEVIDIVESNRTQLLKIQGKIGEMHIDVNKEKGVRIASSTCPCQICVNSGWSKNEALVCVPNAVIIQPITKSHKQSSNNVDAVTR